MINRKALWISSALILIMLAAALWRISLLAHWMQLPRFGENGEPIQPINSLNLLVEPAMVFFIVARLAVRGWMAKASDEARQPWKKWSASYLVGCSVIVTLLQFYAIARSLGVLVSLSPTIFARGGLISTGLIIVMISNSLPKLPWLASKIGILDLNSESGARLLRFRGRMGVSLGLVVVFGALLLPISTLTPLVFLMSLSAIGVGLLFRIQLKRNQLQ